MKQRTPNETLENVHKVNLMIKGDCTLSPVTKKKKRGHSRLIRQQNVILIIILDHRVSL